MKRSMLATALCSVLMSPLVDADDAEFWELLQQTCATQGSASQHEQCKKLIRELVTLSVSGKPRRVIAQQVVGLTQRYGCTDEELPNYGLTRDACLRGIAGRAAHCEQTQLPSVKVMTIMDFLICIVPARACNDFTTKDDPAWKAHCEELDWDGKG